MLELKNISKTYFLKKGKVVHALKDFSFTFPDVGMVFIVGKSGSGKSTMLNILGLLDEYDEGDFLIANKSTREFTDAEKNSFRANQVGFIFQEFHIIDKFSIAQNISLPLELNDNYSQEAVLAVLSKVGLQGYENRKATELSGGQKQRVAIARAIIKNPQIILADEPTGSLDSVTGTEIFNALKELSRERLVIIISHDIDNAHKYADKILEIRDGELFDVYDGDGGLENVAIKLDNINPDNAIKLNQLLDSGKKVVLTKPKPPNPPNTQPKQPMKLSSKATALPLSSTIKLSFFSIKQKWVKTLMTIFISCLAFSFFGFSSIISAFDINKLTLQDLNQSPYNYTQVGMQKVNKGSLDDSYEPIAMEQEHIDRFNELGLNNPIKHYDYQHHFFMMSLKNHRWLLPNVSSIGYTQYYSDRFASLTEADDFSSLGMNFIAGHAPSGQVLDTKIPLISDDGTINLNSCTVFEVAMSSYALESYKMFGFNNAKFGSGHGSGHGYANGIVLDSVTDFEQIQDQWIFASYGRIDDIVAFKLVGVYEVDYSKFAPLADIKEPIDKMTDEQKALAQELWQVQNDNLLTLLVGSGMYEKYFNLTATMKTFLSLGDDSRYMPNAIEAGSNVGLNTMYVNIFQRAAVLSNIKTYEDIPNNSITLDSEIAMALFPDLTEGITERDNLRTILNAIVKDVNNPPKITVNTQTFAQYNSVARFNSFELTIIGISRFNDKPTSNPFAGRPLTLISEDVTKSLYSNCAGSFFIPSATSEQRQDIINKVVEYGEFSINGDVYRWAVVSPNSSLFLIVDSYFSLFTKIFLAIAFVLLAFALLLTYTFISSSISLRKKDIGILRSIGARKIDIAKVFIFEGIFIALLEVLLGSIVCFVFYKLLNFYFIGQMGSLAKNFTILSFGYIQVVLIAAATIPAVALSIFFPVFRISRKLPVDAIRG